MVYLFVFAVSIFFARQAELRIDKGRPFKKKLFFAAFGPIMLAGLRAKNVGMDVQVYVEPVFKLARSSVSLMNFYARHGDGTEYGYLTYMYFLTKIFDSFFVVMLANHAIIVGCCLYALFYFKRRYGLSLTFAYLIMLFHFYNPSLCLIRQSLALSIALVGLVLMLEKKYVIFGITAVIAVLMHKSMLSFVVAYLMLYVVFSHVKSNKCKILALVSIFCSLSFANALMEFAKTFIDTKYVDRIASSGSNEGGWITIAIFAFFAIIPFVVRYLKKNYCVNLEFFLFIPVFGVIFQILGKQSIYLTRLAVPFVSIIMLSIPYSVRNKKIQIFFTLFLLLWWILNIYIRKDWETVPYVMGDYFGI